MIRPQGAYIRNPYVPRAPLDESKMAEDETYMANVLAQRACALCGTDRRARSRPVAARCASCGEPFPGATLYVRVGPGGALALGSLDCVRRTSTVEAPGTACPVCDTPWSDVRTPSRACGMCAAHLNPGSGYVARFRAGRVHAFCGLECLEGYETRGNPFCG